MDITNQITSQTNQIYYQAICKSWYFIGQTRYISKSWAFKSHLYFKIREHDQKQLYFRYKVCWILYKTVGALSFSQPYLCIQPPLQSPPKICSPRRLTFTSLFRPYFFIKSSLQSPQTLSSSIPQQFFTSLFLCTAILTIYIKSISLPQLFSQFKLRQWTNEQGSLVRTDTVLISLSSSFKYIQK